MPAKPTTYPMDQDAIDEASMLGAEMAALFDEHSTPPEMVAALEALNGLIQAHRATLLPAPRKRRA